MALMTSMRNRMHVVLWTLLILFVLSMTVGGLVGGANIIDELFGRVDPRTTLGKVNHETISPDYFSQLVSNQLEQIRASGQEITDQQINRARKDVWDNLVQELLMQQEIERLGITATDEEVVYHLRNNPPAFLQSNPGFQTDGVFDFTKYQQAISNPQGNEWAPVEQFMKNTYLPNYKLQQMILSSVSVSEDEVLEEYKKRNLDYTINALHVTQRAFEENEISVSDEDIQAYYNSHLDDYHRDEQRILSMATWKKVPSSRDTIEVMELANDLLQRARGGEPFATLADEYTMDPGNQVTPDSGRGGDLGWFGKGQMVKPFEEAAFNADANSIIGPVETRFGYHIIHVIDKRTNADKEEIHAAHILLKVELGNQTREDLRKTALTFSYDAQDYGFDAALDTVQLTATDSRPLTSDMEYVTGLGSARGAVRFAFNSELGDVSDPFETDNVYAVVVLDSIIEEGVSPLEDVQNQINRILTKELVMEKSKEKAEEYLLDVESGKSIMELTEANIKLEKALNDMKRLSRGFSSVGRSFYVVGALLDAEPGSILGPLETQRGYAIIEFVSVSDFDSTDYQVQHDVLERDLLNSKQNQAFNDWLDDLKTNATIVDNREYYF